MNILSLPHIVRAASLPKPALQSTRHLITLVERLAAWADRQPQHHRLGSWTRL